MQKIAVNSRTFWQGYAPYASATWLAQNLGPDVGGLSAPGWQNAIYRNRRSYPGLDWIETQAGARPRIPPGPLPAVVYVGDGEIVTPTYAPESAPAPEHIETVEILEGGGCRSTRLLTMNAEQAKSVDYLLEAHGFDTSEWEIVTARNNIWNVSSKGENGNDIETLYSSKITVKPSVNRFSVAELFDAVKSAVTPVVIEAPSGGERLLELSFTDMHFGNSDFDGYRDTLARTAVHIKSRTWKRIVLWAGSDFFHVDNFKNTTSNGTPQSSVWWPDAVKDGLEFTGAILELAQEYAEEVYVYYVPGNHDESMAWLFALLLQERYPGVCFDTAIEERKIHTFGQCAIGMTHGDEKTRKDLDRVFVAEFREFASARFREVHMGHLHHEAVIDRFGVITRSLPTAARTDKWHRETGFVGASKVFQLFEWDESHGVTSVHYV